LLPSSPPADLNPHAELRFDSHSQQYRGALAGPSGLFVQADCQPRSLTDCLLGTIVEHGESHMTVETSSKPRVRLCLRCGSTGCCDGPLARPKPWLTRRQLGPALFASLLHDLFVAHLVIYGGDESITPEGATSLKADALFALEHV